LWQSVIDWFNSLPEKIGFALGYAIGSIIKWGSDVLNWIKTEVPKMINNVVKFFSELPSKIWTWLVNTIVKIETWKANMIQKAIEIGSNFINNIINFFKELPSKIWTWLTNTVSKVVSFGSDLFQKGKEAGNKLVTSFTDTIKSLPENMLNIGKNIVEGIWNGISNAKQWITDKVKGFANGILGGIKSALGIHSPSKVFEEQVGKNMALGLGQGFTNSMGSITKDMQNAIPTEFDTNATINGINANNPSASSGYAGMVNAFKEALKDVKVVMNDREMGTFVTDTLERVVYT
jgi:phage-related protein